MQTNADSNTTLGASGADVFLPDGEPYPLPELAPTEIVELEALTAEQVATVRDERSLLIANLGIDQLPHFVTNVEGTERCGTDGEEWPCAAWRDHIDPAQVRESEGLPVVDEPYLPAEITAAEALGMSVQELRAKLGRPVT